MSINQDKQNQILLKLYISLKKLELINDESFDFLKITLTQKPRHLIISELKITDGKYNLLLSKSYRSVEVALKKVFEEKQLQLEFEVHKIDKMLNFGMKTITTYSPTTFSPIEYLELPTRIDNKLKSLGIQTIQEILNYTEKEWLEFYGFGEGMLKELKDTLKKHGFQLM